MWLTKVNLAILLNLLDQSCPSPCVSVLFYTHWYGRLHTLAYQWRVLPLLCTYRSATETAARWRGLISGIGSGETKKSFNFWSTTSTADKKWKALKCKPRPCLHQVPNCYLVVYMQVSGVKHYQVCNNDWCHCKTKFRRVPPVYMF